MIYTQFGSEVRKVIGFQEAKGLVHFIREPDGVSRWINIASLKADGGLKEIQDAITAATCERCGGEGTIPNPHATDYGQSCNHQ